MPNRFSLLIVALMVLGFSFVAPAQNAQQSSTAKSKPAPAKPPAASFDPHDLSGIWVLQRVSNSLSPEPPPLTPWGQAKFNATKPGYGPRAGIPAFGNDPIMNCDPSGYPRIVFDPIRQMEILQLPGRVLQHFQYHEVWRTIWADGRALPTDADLQWNGYASGRWEGDTLVADSAGFDERSWLDHFGDIHSDQMTLQERFRRLDHNTLQLNMTLADPKTYAKPWVAETKTFKLHPELELTEEICVPSEEQFFNQHQRDVAGGKDQP